MNYTIVGFFDKTFNTDNIVEILKKEGIKETQIDNSPYRIDGANGATAYEVEEDQKTSSFWDWLFGNDENNRQVYSSVGAQSHLITVYANNKDEAQRVSEILDNNGALDINDTFLKVADTNTVYSPTKSNSLLNTTESIKVIKENMAVGKREVETGGVKVKSRIIEKPVEETVRLREERVYITRKPVNKVVDGTKAFQDKTIEMHEYGEKPVVEKTTKVVEEITIQKDVNEHLETIADTVRETKVDINDNLTTTDTNLQYADGSNTTYTFKEDRLDRVFESAEKANAYYDYLIANGYDTDDINIMMSESVKNKFYALNDHMTDTSDATMKGAGKGSAIGGTVGAIVGAVAAIGTSVIIPGLGLAIAGPLAAALTGAGAGGATGAVIGALTNAGISESDAKIYETALKNDQIIISVAPKEFDTDIYSQNYGRELYSGNSVYA